MRDWASVIRAMAPNAAGWIVAGLVDTMPTAIERAKLQLDADLKRDEMEANIILKAAEIAAAVSAHLV